MSEVTERVPRDELNRLLVMTMPTGAMPPLPPIPSPRRHPRPESVVAAMLPAIPPPRAPRMRAPTLIGVPTVKAIAPPVAPIIVEEVAPPPALQRPMVAMAPAMIAATVRPHRFALAALVYALVLFALIAVF